MGRKKKQFFPIKCQVCKRKRGDSLAQLCQLSESCCFSSPAAAGWNGQHEYISPLNGMKNLPELSK